MALYDWNGNGKKDIGDDFLEYHIFHESMKDEHSAPRRSGNGMSTFGAVLCVIAGLVLQALLYTVLGIDVENVPVIVIIILWVVFSALAAVVAEKIGL